MDEKRMTVRDFIGLDVDMDVYDDMTEELAIAFVGPMKLTAAGEERFAEVLDMQIEITEWDGEKAAYLILSEDEEALGQKLKKAKTFFYACAGYCNDEDYETWFAEV